jgi:uncharacterized metal-binding protein YceD (DUF177 family)
VKVFLSEIPEGHGRLEKVEPAAGLDLGGWVRARGGVQVSLDTDRRGQQITLRGVVRVEGEYECARCLREIPARLEGSLLLLADRRGSDDPRDEEALEQEGEVLYHEGVELDLGPAVREAVILEVPQVVLCRPDCRGLCPQCGEDRNLVDCACGKVATDPRWERLQSLRNSDPEPPR